MITEKDIVVGAKFITEHKFCKDVVIKILDITNQGREVKLDWNGTKLIRQTSTVLHHLSYYEYELDSTEKPLDKAFKELDKIYCSHKNVRKDSFFSARIYLTCRDCGKSLD